MGELAFVIQFVFLFLFSIPVDDYNDPDLAYLVEYNHNEIDTSRIIFSASEFQGMYTMRVARLLIMRNPGDFLDEIVRFDGSQ